MNAIFDTEKEEMKDVENMLVDPLMMRECLQDLRRKSLSEYNLI